MRRTWLGFGVVVGFLAAGACTTDSGGGTKQAASPACIQACDAAYDRCSLACEDAVDNDLCSQECIDELDSCKKRCD